jgi:hypothetical protein
MKISEMWNYTIPFTIGHNLEDKPRSVEGVNKKSMYVDEACITHVKQSSLLVKQTVLVIAVSGGNNGYITTILVYITSFVCTRMQNWTRSLCQANKYIVVF